jgi:hypothetical protein
MRGHFINTVCIARSLLGVVIIVMGSTAIAGGTNGASHVITPAEKTYLGAAISYLHEANTLGTKVAKVMNGANDGSSTLGDIRDAMESAKSLENVGYHGDYLDRIKGVVPKAFVREQQQIDDTHRLFQAAMKEYLEYWKDSNAAHIQSGSTTFKRCVLTMNAAIASTNVKMKSMSAK